MEFKVEHLIKGVTLTSYESLYFNEEFNKALCEKVKLHRRLVSLTVQNGVLNRVVEVGPDREIPGPVAKILGADRIAYTEHVEYRLGSGKGSWKTISSVMTEKVESAGSFSFKETPQGVIRVVDGFVKVKIFAVGGMVEKFIAHDVEQGYQQAADFTHTWVAEKGLPTSSLDSCG
jgi:hypothetical protein